MKFPNMLLSHFELYVQNITQMESFYRDVLGFVVTDRGAGSEGMVFLSRSPEEHHQLVLNPRPDFRTQASPLDHISFRVAELSDLRQFYRALSEAGIDFDAVSHGTTWSLYFRDPENNRLEIFTDTPWYVHQPCKFKVDLSLSDEELYAHTEAEIKDMPGFSAASNWRKDHTSKMDT
ncbi:glyoxalase [Hahella sp. CCB-MM4]|uniref:VOC family protein n=1 Tax=Hahella sp. (strain CCB-MM4) TaxID=1926491 RepID=UPI000B9B7777|nr:VOC family protein [Hahella sp. CCB-MM4]OZG72341.1 glyoxalase [Hahella sp. CCB-MM4]